MRRIGQIITNVIAFVSIIVITYIERDYIFGNGILKCWIGVEFFSRIFENIYFYGYTPNLV